MKNIHSIRFALLRLTLLFLSRQKQTFPLRAIIRNVGENDKGNIGFTTYFFDLNECHQTKNVKVRLLITLMVMKVAKDILFNIIDPLENGSFISLKKN